MPRLRVLRLRGIDGKTAVDYHAAARLQESLRSLRRQGATEDCLILLQHPPVYTLGRRTVSEVRKLAGGGGRQHEHLLFDGSSVGSAAEVIETKRGGQVTYHGPGQLVGYPVLHLRQLARRDSSLSPRGYLPAVEEALRRTLTRFGVVSRGRSNEGAAHAGLWIGDAKVAAMGAHISHGISSHGFALNVTPEPLPYFGEIVPCGLVDGAVTCLSHHLPPPLQQAAATEATAGDLCTAGSESDPGEDGARLVEQAERVFVEEFVARFGYGTVEEELREVSRRFPLTLL
jgi:lipoate-protein ligase B